MLAFFVFRIKWEKDQIMLESDAVGNSAAFEREGFDWFELEARGFEN